MASKGTADPMARPARHISTRRWYPTFAKLFKTGFVLLELGIVIGSYVLAFLLLFGTEFTRLPMDNFTAFVNSIPLFAVATLIFMDLFGMTHFFRKTNVDVVNAAFRFSLLEGVTVTAAAFFARGFSFPRSVILYGTVVLFILTSLWGALGLAISRRIDPTGKMVVVGSSLEEARKAAEKISGHLSALHLELVGICSHEDIASLHRAIDAASEVLVCPNVPDDGKVGLIIYCTAQNKPVYIVPQLVEVAYLKTRLVQFSDMPAFMIDRLGLTFEQRLLKRVFDVLLSVVVLVLSSPVMLIAAIAVRATSRGPAIYSQERVTRDNRNYRIFKFRSMRIDAESDTGPVISGKADPRVTPVGRLLRRLKIDELPQFLNVLIGEMSVVGPRSERPFFVQQFEKAIPGYHQRFRVKAGITGFAQVAGSYDTLPEDKLRYDLIYIKNYSILLDIRLVLETVKVVFSTSLYNRTFDRNLTEFSSSTRRKEGPEDL